jgi:hypothetical protein
MIKYRKLFVIFFLFLSKAFVVYAKPDREMMESKKCSNIFSYFERKHNIPRNTLHSISLRETQKTHSKHKLGITWPWTVTVNPDGKGYHFRSKNEAVNFVRAQLALGKRSLDVGCMQINLKYHPNAFKSVEQAFTPRKNIAYGAKFLEEKYQQYGNWQQAIGAYHSGSIERSIMYYARVKKISDSMRSYKKKLADISYHSYKNEDVELNSYIPKKSKTKFLGMGRVSVRVGTLKNNNWFRRTK